MSKALNVKQYFKIPNQGLYFRGNPSLFRLTAAPLPGARLALIPIIPTGEFYRDDLGYFTITKQDLFRIAANARERSDLLQIDYNHSAFNSKAAPTEKVAAGWINRRSLFIAPWGRGYLLMGWAYLTYDASNRRARGELLYISPSIVKGRREIGRPGAPAGQEIGWSLVNVGLVDVPFFDMPPVALFSKSGQNQPRPFTFGDLTMEEQLKTALANLLSTLGVAPDLIPSGVEGLMQLWAQTMMPAAPAAPAAMAAAPVAPVAAPAAAPAAPAAFNLWGRPVYTPQPAPVAYPWPQQSPTGQPQLFNWGAPHMAALNLPNGQRVVAPVQVAPLPAPTAPQPQVDPNIAALFGAVQNLTNQVGQLGQQVAGQQYQQAEQNGQNAALQWAGLNPALFAQQNPAAYQQFAQAAPAFVGPVAFSPLPRAALPAQFAGLAGLAANRQDKGKMLLAKVTEYRDKQAQSGRVLDYSSAMSEARNLGLLAGLE